MQRAFVYSLACFARKVSRRIAQSTPWSRSEVKYVQIGWRHSTDEMLSLRRPLSRTVECPSQALAGAARHRINKARYTACNRVTT